MTIGCCGIGRGVSVMIADFIWRCSGWGVAGARGRILLNRAGGAVPISTARDDSPLRSAAAGHDDATRLRPCGVAGYSGGKPSSQPCTFFTICGMPMRA